MQGSSLSHFNCILDPLELSSLHKCSLIHCEYLVLDLELFELCGISDSLSKHHQLVTLGGCRLLDEKVKIMSSSK
jgi:hypothetical protein